MNPPSTAYPPATNPDAPAIAYVMAVKSHLGPDSQAYGRFLVAYTQFHANTLPPHDWIERLIPMFPVSRVPHLLLGLNVLLPEGFAVAVGRGQVPVKVTTPEGVFGYSVGAEDMVVQESFVPAAVKVEPAPAEVKVEATAPAKVKAEPGQIPVKVEAGLSYTDAQRRELMATAVKAKDFSYSPYSKFRVGAGLLTESGKIYMGCNVENASYGGCICAERTVYVKAVSEGHTRFPAIAVATDLDYFAAPCGMCRQFMAEFGTETVVILTRAGSSDEFEERTVGGLLPESFGPKDLQ